VVDVPRHVAHEGSVDDRSSLGEIFVLFEAKHVAARAVFGLLAAVSHDFRDELASVLHHLGPSWDGRVAEESHPVDAAGAQVDAIRIAQVLHLIQVNPLFLPCGLKLAFELVEGDDYPVSPVLFRTARGGFRLPFGQEEGPGVFYLLLQVGGALVEVSLLDCLEVLKRPLL
jgi:hypothetical protein